MFITDKNDNILPFKKEDDVNQAFLNVLRKLGLESIKEISDITGLDQATVSRHFHKKQPLNFNHIEIYSEKLKVPKGKLVDDEIPAYVVVGYVNTFDGHVESRGDEDAQKVVFHNEYIKEKGTKILYNNVTKHALRYSTNCNPQKFNEFVGSYSFVRYNKPYLEGLIGFVTTIEENDSENIYCELIMLDGKRRKVKNYLGIYPIISSHNLIFNPNKSVQLIEF
jgi:hypothetical protein